MILLLSVNYLFFILILLQPQISDAFSLRVGKVIAPPNTRISAEDVKVEKIPLKDEFLLYLSYDLSTPFNITALGPFGEKVIIPISKLSEIKRLRITRGIIKNKDVNPESLSHLPIYCPRINFRDNFLTYNANLDHLNNRPSFQLIDPDAMIGDQYKSFTEMDGKNVLLLKSVTIRYDYEDRNILDYSDPHPVTGKHQEIYEGEGGFYANFHYAIVPFNKKILTMDRQTLLHLAQGKLDEINKNYLRPRLRTHSFIPGPYLSQEKYLYKLCEWGDTTHQIPQQTLNYIDMAIWDWDYTVKDADHVLMIVWEGDEEDWMVRSQMIHPFVLTDDVVGIFEIKMKETVEPLILINDKGDFEITVQTGHLSETP